MTDVCNECFPRRRKGNVGLIGLKIPQNIDAIGDFFHAISQEEKVIIDKLSRLIP